MKLCANCGQRPGTERISEGTVAFIHGMYEMWCALCVAEKQLEYARKRAEVIPELEAEVRRLRSEDSV